MYCGPGSSKSAAVSIGSSPDAAGRRTGVSPASASSCRSCSRAPRSRELPTTSASINACGLSMSRGTSRSWMDWRAVHRRASLLSASPGAGNSRAVAPATLQPGHEAGSGSYLLDSAAGPVRRRLDPDLTLRSGLDAGDGGRDQMAAQVRARAPRNSPETEPATASWEELACAAQRPGKDWARCSSPARESEHSAKVRVRARLRRRSRRHLMAEFRAPHRYRWSSLSG